MEQALLWSLLQEDPECSSRLLLDKAAKRQCPIRVSLRHLNRWRAIWRLSRQKGRPSQSRSLVALARGVQVVEVTPAVSFVGVHLFARWLEQQDAFAPVVAGLKQAIAAHQQAHPGDDIALLHHRDATLCRRFQALFFAPLLGIERLTAFDTQEHPLETLIGGSYQSSTLSQFLAHLERVAAARALMACLSEAHTAQMVYVDGHMIAYWSRKSMHKGKITMRGRIMAGSQAVISHDDQGQGVFVAYEAPDRHLSQVILPYCEQVAEATGSRLFVIDRAVNSLVMARAFDEQGLGLLCMLDDNEHQGRESFEATMVETRDDGTRLYQGPWRPLRPNDPRTFVIVEPAVGKTLVYWATPKVQEGLDASQWPQVYRARTEIQENSFKGMIDHGALDIHYGRKTILGPDRHQQRARAKLEVSFEAANQRVEKRASALAAKREQVAESQVKGHGKRLEQRQGALAKLDQELSEAKQQSAQVEAQLSAIGPPKERADRDFRKQTIMTIRTLFLENMLRAFMALLLSKLPTKVSLEQVLTLLFERSGTRVETRTEVVYWVNSAGLSRSYRRLLAEIVDGISAMGLSEQGKSIRVCLKAAPP